MHTVNKKTDQSCMTPVSQCYRSDANEKKTRRNGRLQLANVLSSILLKIPSNYQFYFSGKALFLGISNAVTTACIWMLNEIMSRRRYLWKLTIVCKFILELFGFFSRVATSCCIVILQSEPFLLNLFCPFLSFFIRSLGLVPTRCDTYSWYY